MTQNIRHYIFITAGYNKFTSPILDVKIKQKVLVDKSAIGRFISNADLSKTLATLAGKSESKAQKDKMIKLKMFDSSFEDDGTQNYLVFKPTQIFFKRFLILNIFSTWKSKRLSDEIIKLPYTSNNNLATGLNYVGYKIRVRFDGSYLKQDKITFTHAKTVNIYIVYEINLWDRGYGNYPTLIFLFVSLVQLK